MDPNSPLFAIDNTGAGLLKPDTFMKFWISWKGGLITVGKGNIVGVNKFLMYKPVNMPTVAFLGVKTGVFKT